MLLTIRSLMLGGILLAIGSTPSISAQPTTSQGTVPCPTKGQISTHNSADLTVLQQSIETGPLYAIPAASAGVAECHISDDSGVLKLNYRFRDGGWLNVKRNSRIEYLDQEAQFTLPASEDPVAILKRAEQKAFGLEGCSIDWGKPEMQSVSGDTSATETVFRGDVCNCQARIRRDVAKRVIRLIIRSAC